MAKIIRTPARNLTVCGDRPNASDFFPPPPPVTEYALNFDGVNDYLQNDASTPFTQWERTQATTFYTKLFVTSSTLSYPVFSTLTNNDQGILYFITNRRFSVQIRSNSGTDRLFVRMVNEIPRDELNTIQVTYDGSNDANNINIYVNGVLAPKDILTNALTASIINTQNSLYIGRLRNTDLLLYNSYILNVSFVDYVQNAAERSNDLANGFQTAPSGNFLFNLPLIYKDNGTGNIATLDSTIPIPEQAQNLDMNYFGYPNPLVLDTNLIEI